MVEPIEQSNGPASKLSTIVEEPSELTKDTMFIHDEPNWEVADLEATRGCLSCASDGQETAVNPGDDSAECEWGYPITEDNEGLLESLMSQSYPTVAAPSAEEDYLELCCTVDTAKLSYQDRRGGR